jgi:hypothetical protein
MKRSMVLGMLLVGGVLCLAEPVCAQFYPGYGYDGWGGFSGAAALQGSDNRQAAIISARTQSRLAGQQAAQQQNAFIASGIRNTVSGQADARQAAIANQQQQTQDWWFQHQQQQFAQQQMTRQMAAQRQAAQGQAEYSTADAPATGWSGLAPSRAPPPASMDIIQWPTLLQEPCFAAARAKIEAPYRRTPPKLSAPNEEDYQQMAAAVDDMRAILEWRQSEGVNTNQFNAARNFLIQLGGELNKRIHSGNRA